MVALAFAAADIADRRQRHERLVESLSQLYVARAKAHGCALPPERVRALLGLDIELNAQGLEIWMARHNEVRPPVQVD